MKAGDPARDSIGSRLDPHVETTERKEKNDSAFEARDTLDDENAAADSFEAPSREPGPSIGGYRFFVSSRTERQAREKPKF